jgi:divalent metal cation (Fe/Co/Zn/Cd) transporter
MGKAEPLAATVVSFALFGAAVVIAIESIHEIRTPHYAPAPFTLMVLAVVVVIKEILFRYVVTIGEGLGSTAVKDGRLASSQRCHHIRACLHRHFDCI